MSKTTLEKMKVGCNQIIELILGTAEEEPMSASTSDVGGDVGMSDVATPIVGTIGNDVGGDVNVAKKGRKKKNQ